MQSQSGVFPKPLIWVVCLSLLSGVVFFAREVRGESWIEHSAHLRSGLKQSASAKNGIALVYEGPGSCAEDCTAGAANAARRAGFSVKIVGPRALAENASEDQVAALFRGAKVWVQPGGKSRTAALTMTQKLKSALVSFVRAGGGYVGYCAGAFLSTPIIGSTGVAGLGLFPGKTWPYSPPPARAGLTFSIEKLSWYGGERHVYFEGGPYLLDLDPSVEVTARYADGLVAAARAPVGAGRIYISGPHPEAPEWWTTIDRVVDPDGTDEDLASHMILWAAKLR
jgi:glutamine amidotransferase-like uncharacterized protein